jgi:hypothetical protein
MEPDGIFDLGTSTLKFLLLVAGDGVGSRRKLNSGVAGENGEFFQLRGGKHDEWWRCRCGK